jgi:SPP1 gp7 family putative phage head morphogenesis protein
VPLDPPSNRRGRAGRRTTEDDRRRAIREFDARALDDEDAYRRAALRLFGTEAVSIEQLLERIAERSKGRVGPDDPVVQAALRSIRRAYAPGGVYHSRWVESYADLIGETMRVGGKDLAAGLGLDFRLTDPNVTRAVERRAEDLATFIGESSGERVTTVIRETAERGATLRDVAARVRAEAFDGEVTQARAERIARHETASALSTGEYESAQATGVVETIEWFTVGDDRVRDSHRDQHGMKIPLGETFPNGCRFPGDPEADISETAGCRCAGLYSA